MDWKGIRSKILGLMAPNGLIGSIPNLAILGFKFLGSILMGVGLPTLVMFVIMAISGVISGLLGDSFLVAIITFVFMILGYVLFLFGLCFTLVGIANLAKNYIQTGNLVMSDIFFAYKSDNKGLILKTMFVWMLVMCLGSACCVVPGLIWSLFTFFVPYILTENPDMTVKEIIQLSMEMSKGYRKEYIINIVLIPMLIAIPVSFISCCVFPPFVLNLFIQSMTAAFYLLRVSDFDGSNDENDYESTDMESGDMF